MKKNKIDILYKLTVRNLRVFLRDRSLVFFSFLSVLIIIGLYILFLGKIQVDNIKQSVGDINGIRFLVDSWIMSGLLAVNAVTVTLGVLGTMVRDMEGKQFSDFIVAPISRTSVVMSYLISSWIIGMILNLIAFLVTEIYIVSFGGEWLGMVSMLKAIGLLALAVVSSSSIMFLVVTYIKSTAAFGTLSALLGALIGFITGVYVPIGILPEAVQKFLVLIPFSHSAAAMRQIFCEKPLQAIFGGAPEHIALTYEKMNGIRLFWNNDEMTIGAMIAVLVLSGVIFLLLSALRLRKYKQA